MIAKHEAAQRFAEIMIEKLENPCLVQTNGRMAIIAENAFKLADAMQVEADERNKAEAEQKRKEVREILNDANTFIEREGRHFDDVEWQPDWSQAPEWANWWLVDNNGDPQWYSKKPNIVNNFWFVGDPSRGRGAIYRAKEAPSFGYQGNWQDSLRKRPQ